jgi:hypothetical protein
MSDNGHILDSSKYWRGLKSTKDMEHKRIYLNLFLEEGNFYRNNDDLLGIKDVETILILKSS